MRRTAAIILVFAGVLLTGCQDVLFPHDEPRTQFEMHERMRAGFVPLEEPDVFGNPQPNLRARLGQQP